MSLLAAGAPVSMAMWAGAGEGGGDGGGGGVAAGGCELRGGGGEPWRDERGGDRGGGAMEGDQDDFRGLAAHHPPRLEFLEVQRRAAGGVLPPCRLLPERLSPFAE